MNKASKKRIKEVKKLAAEICIKNHYPPYSCHYNPLCTEVEDSVVRSEVAAFIRGWDTCRNKKLQSYRKNIHLAEIIFTAYGWYYKVVTEESLGDTKIISTYNKYFSIEYYPCNDVTKVIETLQGKIISATKVGGIEGAVVSIKQRNKKRLKLLTKKKQDTKREVLYHKPTKQHLIVLLEKFSKLYDNGNGGISMSKAARVVGVEYKAAKAYLNGSFDIKFYKG